MKEKVNKYMLEEHADIKKSNMTKNVVTIIVSIILLIAFLIGKRYYGYYQRSKPVVIDLNKYVDFYWEGYNGVAKGKITFKLRDLKGYYNDKIKARKSKKSEIEKMKKEMQENHLGIVDDIDVLVSKCIEISSEDNENLSNGDVVELRWNCDEEFALKYFNVKLKYKDEDFVLNELTELQEVDPFTAIDVGFYGDSGHGVAVILNSESNENFKDLVYSFTENSGQELSNGMTVSVKVTDKDGNASEYMLAKNGIRLTALEKEYVVSGLKEGIPEENKQIYDEFLHDFWTGLAKKDLSSVNYKYNLDLASGKAEEENWLSHYTYAYRDVTGDGIDELWISSKDFSNDWWLMIDNSYTTRRLKSLMENFHLKVVISNSYNTSFRTYFKQYGTFLYTNIYGESENTVMEICTLLHYDKNKSELVAGDQLIIQAEKIGENLNKTYWYGTDQDSDKINDRPLSKEEGEKIENEWFGAIVWPKEMTSMVEYQPWN